MNERMRGELGRIMAGKREASPIQLEKDIDNFFAFGNRTVNLRRISLGAATRKKRPAARKGIGLFIGGNSVFS